jgi:hypothetical protein
VIFPTQLWVNCGSEKNKQLRRISCTAFASRDDPDRLVFSVNYGQFVKYGAMNFAINCEFSQKNRLNEKMFKKK